jgi:hypothetical protein
MFEPLFWSFSLGVLCGAAVFIGIDLYQGTIEVKDGKIVDHACVPERSP